MRGICEMAVSTVGHWTFGDRVLYDACVAMTRRMADDMLKIEPTGEATRRFLERFTFSDAALTIDFARWGVQGLNVPPVLAGLDGNAFVEVADHGHDTF